MGDLSEIPTVALLQVLELSSKTGLLQIDWSDGGGRIWLRLGAPVHAETGNQVGFDAAVSIANAASGQFRFEPDVASPEQTIQASVTALLLEAARQIDETSA